MHRYEHSEAECECGDAEPVEKQGEHSTGDVEDPWGVAAHHDGFDHLSHGVSLWCHERVGTGESVDFIEQEDNSTYSSCRYECANEFPSLLFAGCGAEPIADLEVGHESSCHGEGGAYNTSDYH